MSDLMDVLRGSYDIEDEVLTDIGLREYTVSLRSIVRVGEDVNKGIKGTETITDTLLTPTPDVSFVSVKLVKRKVGYFETGDIWVKISATTYTRDQLLQFDGLVYHSKLWKFIMVDGIPNIGTPLQWRCLCRKLKDL